MKRSKSIFLWCGELVEQWRGWLPWSVLFSRFAQRRFAHFQTKGTSKRIVCVVNLKQL